MQKENLPRFSKNYPYSIIFNFSMGLCLLCYCLEKDCNFFFVVDLLGTFRSNGVKSLARFVKIKTCSSDMVQMWLPRYYCQLLPNIRLLLDKILLAQDECWQYEKALYSTVIIMMSSFLLIYLCTSQHTSQESEFQPLDGREKSPFCRTV